MPEHLLTFEFITTFLIFLSALTVAGAMIWLDQKPRDSLSPRLLPTTAILMVAGLVLLLAVVHLVNLGGIQTGR